jgi:uncharacterized protein (DUF2147 family)
MDTFMTFIGVIWLAISDEVSAMRSLFALVFLVALLPVAAHAADPVGVWSAGEGKIRVKIDSCGEVLCGKIVWVSEAEAQEASRKGQPPIIGVQLLSDLKPSADRTDQWEGKVFNLQDGKTYNVYLRPTNTQMEVEGCLLIFCRTQIWPRVEESGEVPARGRIIARSSTLIRHWGSAKPSTASPVEAGPGGA